MPFAYSSSYCHSLRPIIVAYIFNMSSFTIEAFTLLGVGVFVICMRLVARVTAVGIKNLQLDDYLMVVAAVS